MSLQRPFRLPRILFDWTQFFYFDVAIEHLGELELQGDFALCEGNPLAINLLLNMRGMIIHFAVHDVSGLVAVDDDLHCVPAVMFVHGTADDPANAVADALNEGNSALLRRQEVRED